MATQYKNFYDKWLHMWEDSQEEKKRARTIIHEEELEWVETPQDYRIALMAGPENGFRTWGTEITIADIPAGHHTGKHEHGEEGVYIVDGEGFSVVNGQRFDWQKGCVLWMPFGSQHQHFNTGDGNARYLSFTALNLEHFAGLGRVDQWQEKGFTDTPIDAEVSKDGRDRMGRRISVEDRAPTTHDREALRASDQPMADAPAEHRPEEQAPGPAGGGGGRSFMGRTLGPNAVRRSNNDEDRGGWANMEIEISSALERTEGRHSGKHAHMEAYLYVIEGEGYTVVDGERVDWKKGSLLHVQGPQTSHQHFNTGDVQAAQLRLAPGLRFRFFEPLARERFPYLIWGGAGESTDDQLKSNWRAR